MNLDNLIKYKAYYNDDLIEKLFQENLIELKQSSASFVCLFVRNNFKLCKCLLDKVVLSEILETSHFKESINEIISNNNQKLAEYFFEYLRKNKIHETDLYRYFFDTLLQNNKDELIGVALEIIKNNKKLLFEIIKKLLNSNNFLIKILTKGNSNVLIDIKLPKNQNILHLAVTHFDFDTFNLLAANINNENIFTKVDENNQTPMDIIIQRSETESNDFEKKNSSRIEGFFFQTIKLKKQLKITIA